MEPLEVVSILYLVATVAALAQLWSQPRALIRHAHVNPPLWTIRPVFLPFITPRRILRADPASCKAGREDRRMTARAASVSAGALSP